MTARFLTLLTTLVVVLAGIGCGQGSGSQKPNNQFALSSPNPLAVTEHLDTSHSAAAIMDSTGGTLTATGADGVNYTLTIPAKAVPSSTEVRMTPVASLDGMPWQGGLLAAVHIEPDGLQLLRPAVLVADGVRPAPAGTKPTGFMYEETGIDFRLYPLDAGQRTRFQLHLFGFSSPGIGGATKQDITTQSQRPPCTPIEQLQQDIARTIMDFRTQQITGQIPQDAPLPPELIAKLQQLLDGFRNGVVKPEIDQTGKSNATIEDFPQALGDLGSWKREADILNLEATGYDALLKELLSHAKHAFRDGVNRCFMHDVLAGMMAFELLRYVLLTNAGTDMPLDPIDRCLRFKLTFETQHQLQTPQATATMTVKSTVEPITITAGGSGALNPAFVVSASAACSVSGSTEATGAFKVLGLFLNYRKLEDPQNWTGKSRAKYLLDRLNMHMTPGKATETFTFACPAPVGTHSGVCATCYEDDWGALHMDEKMGDLYAISGWTITNGQHLLAHKDDTDARSYAGAIKELKTTFDLWHEPVGNGMP